VSAFGISNGRYEVRDNVIYQIRGLYNRMYKNEEYQIVKLWGAAEKLKLVA